MRRRTWALLVAVVLAVAGAVIGSVVATGLGGGGDSSRPTGAETVLRVQPVEEQVSCGPGPAAVYIFLDDLAARPSPSQPDASYGVAAFQFLLRYDPQILRIGEPVNVELNPRLSQEDADGDGLVRSFFAVSDIDDFAGLALLGASSFVPSAPGPESQREEGLDPVARGEPLLLMTVRFVTVGHGTSNLTLEPGTDRPPEFEAPLLLDPSGQPYEPIALRGAGLTVARGDCPPPPPATPRPTPRPTSTPGIPLPPLPTPILFRPVTPQAPPASGRTDCPSDWVVYTDAQERFSICYPADFSATASDRSLNASSPRIPGATEGVTVVVYWDPTPGTIYHPPSPENCANDTGGVPGPVSSTFVELTLRSGGVGACFTQGRLSSELHGAIPLARDGSDREGFIQFILVFGHADLSRVPSVGQSIIDSLSVNFR